MGEEKMRNRKDISNQKFGTLIAIEPSHKDKRGRWFWLCKCCICGKQKTVEGTNLRTGHTQSCGYTKNKTHGASKTLLYGKFKGMKQRCYYKNHINYSSYGERGIKICDEWHNFETFKIRALKNGYQDNLTIERIDVNEDYTPENCT
jgi:hypothetical protein